MSLITPEVLNELHALAVDWHLTGLLEACTWLGIRYVVSGGLVNLGPLCAMMPRCR